MHTPSKVEDTGTGKGKHGKNRVLLDAAAGAVAGCVSRFVVGPLDVIKIRFQVQLEPIGCSATTSKYTSLGNAFKTIVREEGIPGLWRGTVPGLLLTVPYTAVQFVALQQFRIAAKGLGLGDGPPWLSFTSGAIAGAAATIASYPFDLLRTTLAAQGEPKVYRGMVDAARGIVAKGGVQGLYRGLGVTLVEIIPYASLQFGLYDSFNYAWRRAQGDLASRAGANTTRISSSSSSRGGGSIGPSAASQLASLMAEPQIQSFSCGLMSGLLAKLVSHPLDVAKKRYQIAGLARSLKYGARVDQRVAIKPLFYFLREIYLQEGPGGLWKGTVPSLIKAAPAAAVTFAAYDAFVKWMAPLQEGAASEEEQ